MFQFLIGTVKTIPERNIFNDIVEFQFLIGTVKTKSICDREKGYSLVERNKCLEDEDFKVIRDEEVISY